MAGPHSRTWQGDTVRWLTHQLDWLYTTDLAADFRREVTRLVRHLQARYPAPDTPETPRPVPQPCPRCDRLTLVMRAPRYGGDQTRIECTHPDCAAIYDEERWTRLTAEHNWTPTTGWGPKTGDDTA
ncbi:hypothetical protein [Salana multivorans]